MGQAGNGGTSLEDHYFLQKVKLGEGSFGTVWRAVDRRTNEVVAMKQLNKSSLPRRGVPRSAIEREIAMMKACEHENITKLFATFEDEKTISLALEYCDGGDFGDKVKERGLAIQEWEVAEWMQQICSALAALHFKGICHRDIKPDNFMVKEHGSRSSRGQLKLADFGLAVYLPKGRLLREKCGTPAFMAPEQHGLPINSPGYDYAADVWAAGVSMYMVMFGGRHPFLTDQGQLDNKRLLKGGLDFREGAQNRFFGFEIGPSSLRFSELARDLCSSMVCPDKKARCTAEGCLRSPWMSQGQPGQPKEGGGPRFGVPGATGAVEQQPGPAVAENGMVGGHAATGQQGNWYGVPAPSPPAPSPPATLAAAGPPPGWLPVPRQMQNEVRRTSSKEVAWGGILPIGARCRYSSDRFGWLESFVQRHNDDGTYDLDTKQGATLDRIAPTAACSAEKAWPAGTLVLYHSSSADQWLQCVVTSFNEQNRTYTLDLRDNADPDRIRARQPGQVAGDHLPGDEPFGRVPSSQPPVGRVPSTHSAQGSSGAGFNNASVMPGPGSGYPGRDGSVEATMNLHDPRGTAAPDRPRGYGAPGDRRPSLSGWHGEGMLCMTLEHGLVRIQAYSPTHHTYTVLIVNASSEQTAQVLERQLRAPGELPHAWPAGTKVWYDSPSMAEWLPSVVTSFNPELRNYNLDVRDYAAPDRVRPRFAE